MPLLPAGNHLGVWPTYEILPLGTAAAADVRWQEALAAGMEIARVHVGWGELEPSAGRFELVDLDDKLTAATADGLAIHLLIETIDSEGYELPSDLVDPDVEYGLRDGIRFDDPVILDRFAALLDRVLPRLDGHRVFAISVGNEPDNRLDDLEPTEELAWIDQLVGFLGPARTRIQDRFPSIAVAMTLTQAALEKGITTLGPLIEAGDVAAFNYYCQDPDFQVQPASVVAGELDALEQAAAGRPLILQEMGCPAGRANSVISATEAAQAAFYAEVSRQIAARPGLRATFGFLLVDWSPELIAEVAQAYRDQGYDELADQFEETYVTIGLLRYADGTPRPAWSAFVDAIAELR